MEDGLSNTNITSFFQDSRGFVWIGTNYGLNRYDGYEIEVYTKEHDGLGSNIISDIVEDRNGWLWLCHPISFHTREGLSSLLLFSPVTKKIIPLEDYFEDKGGLPFLVKDIIYIYLNKDKSIWISTGDILWEYNGKSFQQKLTAPNRFITKAYKTNKGNGWAEIRAVKSSRTPPMTVVYFDSLGQVLENLGEELSSVEGVPISTKSGGYIPLELSFAQMENSEEAIINIRHQQKDQPVLHPSIRKSPGQPARWAIRDIGKPYWRTQFLPHSPLIVAWPLDWETNPVKTVDFYTLEGQFLFQMPAVGVFQIPTLLDNTKLYKDTRGGIWNYNSGQNRIEILNISLSKFKKRLETPCRGIRKIGEKLCVLGTLPKILDKEMNVIASLDSVKSSLSALPKDKQNLWVTREKPKLFLFNIPSQEVVKTYDYLPDYPGKDLPSLHWVMHKDKNHRLWLGSDKGLSYFDQTEGQLKLYEKLNGFKSIRAGAVFHFHENEQGIWLATSTGLYLLDPQKGIQRRFHSEDSSHYLPHNVIAHIHEDSEGIFWLASKGGGIIKWNPQTLEHQQLTIKNGLSHDVTYAIYGDEYNNLWVSSNYGIMCFDKESHLIRTYHVRDGISHEEFNTISHHQATDGTIYFGGLKGFTYFHPRDFRESNSKATAQLQITSYSKRDEETGIYTDFTSQIWQENLIELGAHEKSFILRFSLLDFKDPIANYYAYKIEGLDKKWTYTDRPEIRVNGLPYGEYQIQIKAQGADGFWLEKQLSINLRVLRPFYFQWWFIGLSITGFLLAIWVLVRLRISRLRKRQKELEEEVKRRTEKIEQQAEDLKALDKLKSRFFTNISHELRTPLTLILGPLSSVLDNPDELSPQTFSKLQTMERNGKSLLQLIEEILDLAKLESNKLELEEKSTVVLPYLRRLFSAFESQAAYQKINYLSDLQINEEQTLWIDRSKLEKIINNLLSNALKFTKPDESITFRVSESIGRLRIEVEDTGSGIHPNDLPYIFERFYQSKQPNRPAVGGTGVGLSLSRELAKLMGGVLDVKSILGQGSSFILSIPKKEVVLNLADKRNDNKKNAEEDQIYPIPLIEETSSFRKSFWVLVVEDNNDMRQFIDGLLSPHYQTICKGNGQAALDYLETASDNLPDLILSDVMMPLLDGFGLLQHLKKHDIWRRIPVMMLTARAAQQDKLQALTIGADDYMIKPFSSKELLVRTRNLLQNYHQRRFWKEEEITKSEPSPNNPKNDSSSKPEPEIPNLSYDDQQWILQVETIVRNKLNDKSFNVTFLLGELFMSESQFRRRLKKITGLTPKKYLREMRLQQARKFIENKTFDTLSEVSGAIGISKTWLFVREFEKRFGQKLKE